MKRAIAISNSHFYPFNPSYFQLFQTAFYIKTRLYYINTRASKRIIYKSTN